jgi:hypothetical protein
MFDFFGFDPSQLSDEELLHRQVQLHEKIAYASRLGSGQMVEGFQQILSAVEFERMERHQKLIFRHMQAAFPPVIETDPDLAAEGKTDAATPGTAPDRQRPRVTITRTTRPTRGTVSITKKDDH